MGWPEKLVLVRHAESEGNVLSMDERVEHEAATHNYALTSRGRKQAEITGEYLREKFGYFDVNYSSYYRRAKETLQLMYPEVPGEPKVKIYEDFRLAEAQRGIYHTLNSEQVKQLYPNEILRRQRENLYHYRPWGGENWPDVELRIDSFLGMLNRDCEGEKVLIVVHGNWLVLLQLLLEHFSIEEALDRYHNSVVENASVTIYNREIIKGRQRLILETHNLIPWKGQV